MTAAAGQLVQESSTLFVAGSGVKNAGTLLAYLSVAALVAAHGDDVPKTIQVVQVKRYEVCVLPGMANYWAQDVETVKRTRTSTLLKKG
jgi:hypothetical protein